MSAAMLLVVVNLVNCGVSLPSVMEMPPKRALTVGSEAGSVPRAESLWFPRVDHDEVIWSGSVWSPSRCSQRRPVEGDTARG